MVTDTGRRRRIQPLLDYWVPQLHLTAWDVSWKLVDQGVLGSEGVRPIAQVQFTPPYYRAFIRIERELADAASAAELELTVIHELCHVLTNGYTDSVRDYLQTPLGEPFDAAHERIAETLASVFYHLRYPRASLVPFEPLEVEEGKD